MLISILQFVSEKNEEKKNSFLFISWYIGVYLKSNQP